MQAKPLFERALMTNDDGIDAPGLAALVQAIVPLAREVWVVAPEHDQSGVSRAVSLRTPLRLVERAERRFALNGTPSDCVILGLRTLLRDNPPDIVISGINRGANLAEEVGYSGTVAAALTARMLGIPAYAVSQAWRDRSHIRWHTAVQGLAAVFHRFGTAPATVLNVNFPDVEPDELAGIAVTRQGRTSGIDIAVETRTDLRGFDYHWLGFRRHGGADTAPDSDVSALRRHQISVTPLGFDLTAHTQITELA